LALYATQLRRAEPLPRHFDDKAPAYDDAARASLLARADHRLSPPRAAHVFTSR